MAQLIRKQIYLSKRQDNALKRLARARGVSETAVIREAIDAKVGNGNGEKFRADPQAWGKAYRFMLSRRDLPATQSAAYKWKREDAYEERESRWEQRRREHERGRVQ